MSQVAQLGQRAPSLSHPRPVQQRSRRGIAAFQVCLPRARHPGGAPRGSTAVAASRFPAAAARWGRCAAMASTTAPESPAVGARSPAIAPDPCSACTGLPTAAFTAGTSGVPAVTAPSCTLARSDAPPLAAVCPPCCRGASATAVSPRTLACLGACPLHSRALTPTATVPTANAPASATCPEGGTALALWSHAQPTILSQQRCTLEPSSAATPTSGMTVTSCTLTSLS